MKRSSILMGALLWTLMAVTTASAQLIPPGGSQFNPPLPPPPPPKIEVPAIPQMDAPVPVPQVQGLQRGSFGDRISKCLEDGATAGLGPNQRSAYSRACANQ